MGVMVTCDKIIEKVIETKADILGLSGKTEAGRHTPSLPLCWLRTVWWRELCHFVV